MNQKVNLVKRVQTTNGQRFCGVVYDQGVVRPDWVRFKGAEEHHPEGSYYIGWYVGRTRQWKNVGRDAAQAQYAAESLAANMGPGGIRQAISAYLEEISLVKRPSTVQRYRTVMKYFEQFIVTNHIQIFETEVTLKEI